MGAGARNPGREFPAGEPQPNAASPILKGRLSRRLPLAPPASTRILRKNRSKLKGAKMPPRAVSSRTSCYEFKSIFSPFFGTPPLRGPPVTPLCWRALCAPGRPMRSMHGGGQAKPVSGHFPQPFFRGFLLWFFLRQMREKAGTRAKRPGSGLHAFAERALFTLLRRFPEPVLNPACRRCAGARTSCQSAGSRWS